jgi:hypothetical protein
MTDNEIVALGSFCEALMCHSAWAVAAFDISRTKRSVRASTRQNTAATDWAPQAADFDE